MARTPGNNASLQKKQRDIGRADIGPPWWRSVRYQIAYISFMGVCFVFFQRVNLSMAVVCMVNHTAVDLLGQHNASSDVIQLHTNLSVLALHANLSVLNQSLAQEQHGCRRLSAKTVSEDGSLVWDKRLQGWLLGAYFWTFLVLQVPASLLARRVGFRLTLTISMTLTSVLTLLTPVVAVWSPYALICLRLILGAVSSVQFVGLYAVWEAWAPPCERSRLVGVTFSGVMVANAVVFPTSALLCHSDLGWPGIFYVYGGGGVVWTVAWFLVIRDTAESHPWISDAEERYIKTTVGKLQHSEKKKDPLPVKKILCCAPFWANVCVHVAFDWGLLLFLLNLPLYMKEVLQFDIASNGMFSMLPYIAMFVVITVSGQVADRLISSGILSVALTRKVITCIGQLIPAALLVGLSYLDCGQAMGAVVMLTLAVGVAGCNYSGFLVNYYDIAPRFAAAMMTIGNVVAMVSGVATPYLVAALTPDKTREQWQIVFFLTAAIFALAALVFLLLGRGEPLPWAVPRPLETVVNVDAEAAVPMKPLENFQSPDSIENGHVDSKLL